MTDAGVKAGLESIAEGASDMEITAAAYDGLLAADSESVCIDPFIAVGWRSGSPHSVRGGGIAAAGDSVFIELSGVTGRYNSPLMRTGVVGAPGRDLQELADCSNGCLDAMIGVMRDGIEISEIAAAGRPMLEPVVDKIIFHYLYGYPVGVGFPPNWIESSGNYLSADNHRTLKAGMVYHLPLMLRVRGQYGAGFSETVIVKEDGVEVMSKIPRRLT